MTMPDETKVWAVPVGTSASYKSDTRVRNMKLNERLLSRKSRDRKLMLPSDSPFQKRTLTKFPMEHNRCESRQKADSQHIGRKLTEDKVRKAKLDSESMRQYSLKMFDNAVDVFTHDHRRVMSDLPSRLKSAHNGPTHDGSVLYNKRSSVLNSIRLRPNSEPPTRFNHLKSETIQPQIRQTLCRSNMNYTVSCVSPTKTHPARSVSTLSYRSDLRLIPNGSLSSEDEFGKSELNDSFFDENDNTCSSNASSSMSMDPCFLKRNLPSAEIHFYSIEEDSCSEDSLSLSKTPEVPQPEEVKKDQLPEPQSEPSRPKSGKGRPKSGRSKGNARSTSPKSPKSKTKRGKSPKGKKGKEKEPTPATPPPQPEVKVIETPPPPKPLKGPKCWVDDATITSEKEILNDDENISNISQTTKPGSPTGKTPIKSQVKTDTGEVENIPTLPEPVKKLDTLVLEEVELVTPDVIPNGLPSYICPSSEERSRQEAIKDWLAKCSFDSANRCVPMF